MFRAVGRRLALLNALVVIGVIAAVGLAMYLYLARRIEGEVDSELQNRATAAVALWSDVFASGNDGSSIASPTPAEASRPEKDERHDEEDDEDEEHARELVRSGDTLAYALNSDGQVISQLRPVEVDGLPKLSSVEQALSGTVVAETMTIDGEPVRLRTEPVTVDGKSVGAIQVGMGLGPNQQILLFLRYATLGGLLFGALLAIPSGWWLANRSMKPIHEAFARQRAFVADASHELRTPLTLVRAEAEFLQRSPNLADSERSEGEAAIIREVDAMALLVSDLLQLARIDAAVLELDRAVVDVRDVANSAVERFFPVALENGIALRLGFPSKARANIDRAAIEQVVAILLDNAIRYTPSGGTIDVQVGVRAGMAFIDVKDTGTGIEAADLGRIFERFYQSDPARSRASGGSGLGLAIAQELVAAHGGKIEVESQPGAGSTFSVLLPLAKSAT